MIHLYKNKIPIKNIYYMLSYAYDFLENEELNNLGDEKFDNAFEMLSIVLVQGVYSQIKRGLYKEYIDKNEDLAFIKGKINVYNTMKCQIRNSLMINCDFEKYSVNNIYNQVIKTTLVLLQEKNINRNIKQKVNKCLDYFSEVDTIKFDYNFKWNKILYNRNNKMYKMLIDICYLINDSLLINELKGENNFYAYFDEKKIAKLYEKFVYAFYSKELSNCSVYFQKKFTYKEISGNITELLPSLYTDILITKDNKFLIIDTKFYQETLNKNEFYQNEKIRSNHMAQMYAYMNNFPLETEVVGMLLYPTIDFEYHRGGTIQNKKIFLNTINLNEDFSNIKRNLLNIVNEAFQ